MRSSYNAHPCVARSYGETDDGSLLVMALAPLGALTHGDGSPSCLTRLCPPARHLPSASLLLRAGAEIAGGARALYEAGLLHRDLRCAKILAFSLEEKVVDVRVAGYGALCERSLYGTPVTEAFAFEWPEGRTKAARWAAPETLGEAGAYSEKTEVYGVGVALWELFSLGRAPFEDVRADALAAHKGSGALPDRAHLGRTKGAATPPVKTLIHLCLAADPKRRPSHADLAADLDRLVASKGATRRGVTAPGAAWAPLSPRVAALDAASAVDARALRLAAAPLPALPASLGEFGVRKLVLASSGEAVFVFPLLTPAFCDELFEELVAFHSAGRSTKAVPKVKRSTRVDELGWGGFLAPLIADVVAPLSDALYGRETPTPKRVALKYSGRAHTEQLVCEDHTRRSPLPASAKAAKRSDVHALTLHVAICGEWKGGGTKFFDGAGNAVFVDNAKGVAVLHPGRTEHQPQPLTDGFRYSLAVHCERR